VSEYTDSPGDICRFSGNESDCEAFSKPGDGLSDAPEDVRSWWRSWGLDDDVYESGRRRTDAGAFGADIVDPTSNTVSPRANSRRSTTHLWYSKSPQDKFQPRRRPLPASSVIEWATAAEAAPRL
jgi:hypothetical protein